MSARFEICRGDDGWWARFGAANGRVVWVTEVYERRRNAVRAIAIIGDAPRYSEGPPFIQVRDVDERSQ